MLSQNVHTNTMNTMPNHTQPAPCCVLNVKPELGSMNNFIQFSFISNSGEASE